MEQYVTKESMGELRFRSLVLEKVRSVCIHVYIMRIKVCRWHSPSYLF